MKIIDAGEKSHVDKQGTEFFQTTNSNEIFPSKAIARKITLSLKFALVILTHKRFFPIKVKRARASLGSLIVCIERRLLVWRKALH